MHLHVVITGMTFWLIELWRVGFEEEIELFLNDYSVFTSKITIFEFSKGLIMFSLKGSHELKEKLKQKEQNIFSNMTMASPFWWHAVWKNPKELN